MRNVAKKASAVIVAGLLAVVAMNALGFSGIFARTTPEELRVQQAATRAIVAHQQLGLSRAAMTGELSPVPASGSAVGSVPTDADGRQQALDAGLALILDLFSDAPTLRAREESALRAAIDSQGSDGVASYVAGVSSVKYTKTAISGTSARTVARVTTWSHFTQARGSAQAKGATPINTLRVTTALTNVAGQWKVTDLQWAFDPATAP